MPELPEVEIIRRGLAPVLEGGAFDKVILRRSGLRFPFPQNLAEKLQDRRVISVRRRAKYLLIDLEDGQTLISHLGMSGSWRAEQVKHGEQADFTPLKHDHVILHLRRRQAAGGADARHGERARSCGAPAAAADIAAAERGENYARIAYNDPRRFGFLLLTESDTAEQHPLLAKLGVEPLSNALSGSFLQQAFIGKKAPLKSALLNQHIIAGLGNIYVCEALWRARLSPWRAAADLSGESGFAMEAAADLSAAIRSVLEDALQSGGSHLRNYRQTDGSLGYFQHKFQVYGREGEPCRRCAALIKRRISGGRSGFYCEKCQE